MWPNLQETPGMVTFTEETLTCKLHSLCSDKLILFTAYLADLHEDSSIPGFMFTKKHKIPLKIQQRWAIFFPSTFKLALVHKISNMKLPKKPLTMKKSPFHQFAKKFYCG